MIRSILASLLVAAGTAAAQAEKPPVETTPEEILGRIAAAGDSARFPGAPLLLVLDATTADVETSGLGHVRRRTLTKVLTETGARDLATRRFDYDPASNLIEIESVRIHRGKGTTETIDPSRAVDLPAPAHLIYWGARMKLLSLPRLRVGDAVEIATYEKGFQIAYLREGGEEDERYVPPMRGHFYDVVLFQDDHPIVEKSYLLRLPRNKPAQHAVYNGPVSGSLRFEGDRLAYRWEARDVAAFEPEPRIPDRSDLVPKVVLATVEDWPEKSRWFFETNESVFEADPAIRRKVGELLDGIEDDEEKMAALLHWVAQEIRYSGISMGKGEGYTLHPGTMTFQDRCGVCKDIAGMLVTMLRVAGYTTHPVMTMAGARVEAIPADQFNHCVVAVERADGAFTLLDPTWAPFSRATWSRWEGEQHYVIGTREGEDLAAMRSFAPEESRMRIDSRARLDAAGDLHATMTLQGKGISDGRLRSWIADAPARDRAGAVARLLAPLGPAVEVVDLEAVDPRDFSRDAEIRVRYRVARYAAACESLIAFQPPGVRLAARSGPITRLLAVEGKPERRYEALLWGAQEVVVEERLDLPGKMRAAEGEAEAMEIDAPAASLTARYRPEGGSIRAELTATLKKRTVPPEEWAGALEAADSLRAFGGRLRWAGPGR